MMTALLAALAVIAFRAWPTRTSDPAGIIQQLETSWPDWLPKLDKCPADVMPSNDGPPNFSIERCSADLDQCLDHCRAGTANDCYAAAIVLQKTRSNRVSEALFLKACALGIVSGCTNRAAGMDSNEGVSCAVRTFQLGCERKDPWACTMTGFHLIRGLGVDKDIDRARKALAQSCRFGDSDEACIASNALLKEIDH